MQRHSPFAAGFEFGQRHRNNPIMHALGWAATAALFLAHAIKWLVYIAGAMLGLFLVGGVLNSMLTWNWSAIGAHAFIFLAACLALCVTLALLRGALAAAPAAILFAVVGGFWGGGPGALLGAALGGVVGLVTLAAQRRV